MLKGRTFIMKTILISAFNAFNQSPTNTSEDVLNQLPNTILDYDVKKVVLNTSFSDAYPMLVENINTFKPSLVFMLGEAASRKKISLEKVANNYVDARIPDNDHLSLKQSKILDHAPDAYFTKLNIEAIDQALSSNYPLEISYSAGTYACNYLYYTISDHIEQTNSQIKCCFIHVPKHGLSHEIMVSALTEILTYALSRHL